MKKQKPLEAGLCGKLLDKRTRRICKEMGINFRYSFVIHKLFRSGAPALAQIPDSSKRIRNGNGDFACV